MKCLRCFVGRSRPPSAEACVEKQRRRRKEGKKKKNKKKKKKRGKIEYPKQRAQNGPGQHAVSRWWEASCPKQDDEESRDAAGGGVSGQRKRMRAEKVITCSIKDVQSSNGRTHKTLKRKSAPRFTASRQGSARLPLDPGQSPIAWSGVQTCEEGAKAQKRLWIFEIGWVSPMISLGSESPSCLSWRSWFNSTLDAPGMAQHYSWPDSCGRTD